MIERGKKRGRRGREIEHGEKDEAGGVMELRGNTIHRGEKSPMNQIFIHQNYYSFRHVQFSFIETSGGSYVTVSLRDGYPSARVDRSTGLGVLSLEKVIDPM